MVDYIKKMWRKNSSRIYLERFAKQAAESLPNGGRVLDAGAGDCPYRDYFSHAHYDSTDLCEVEKVYGKLSFICDIKDLPVRADCYDMVFCSQTLEHMPDPQSVIVEFGRVLKPGGQLWLSAPLYFAEHELPFDYYRYTQFGLTTLMQRAGLTIEKIDWLEGYFGTLSYQLKQAAIDLPYKPKQYGNGCIGWLIVIPAGLLRIKFALLSMIFTRLDVRYKYSSAGHCKNYTVIAVKPTQ